MAFFSCCNESTQPTGVTHCVSAYWTVRRSEALQPNVILARVTQLEVYSVLPSAAPPGRGTSQPEGALAEASKQPGWVMELESTHSLSGEIHGMAVLPARTQGARDALVLAFDEVWCPSVRFLCQPTEYRSLQCLQHVPASCGMQSNHRPEAPCLLQMHGYQLSHSTSKPTAKTQQVSH